MQVIDEADTMFAEGWGTEISEILRPLRAKPDPTRVILVSATLTKVCSIDAYDTKSCHLAVPVEAASSSLCC